MHALIENGTVKQYPYTTGDLKRANPDTSFPSQISDESLLEYGIHRVFNATPPKSDKDVADMQARLDDLAAEIAALQAKDRTPDEEEQLQSMVAAHATETQILQSLPAPYVLMTSVLVEGTPVFSTEDQRWTQTFTVRDMTTEEVQQRDAGQAAQVRSERNALLVASDWTQVADAPVDKAAWATYRQALRDVTQQSGFPWTIEWPTQP
jgi:endonuclease/exonuclease/phosphatase family metal-dependent hydrolase